MRTIFRCIGCYGCQLACKAEHGTPPGVYYARVLKAVIIDRQPDSAPPRPAYRVAAVDQFWVVALALANLVPVLAWRFDLWSRLMR